MKKKSIVVKSLGNVSWHVSGDVHAQMQCDGPVSVGDKVYLAGQGLVTRQKKSKARLAKERRLIGVAKSNAGEDGGIISVLIDGKSWTHNDINLQVQAELDLDPTIQNIRRNLARRDDSLIAEVRRLKHAGKLQCKVEHHEVPPREKSAKAEQNRALGELSFTKRKRTGLKFDPGAASKAAKAVFGAKDFSISVTRELKPATPPRAPVMVPIALLGNEGTRKRIMYVPMEHFGDMMRSDKELLIALDDFHVAFENHRKIREAADKSQTMKKSGLIVAARRALERARDRVLKLKGQA